MCGQAPSLGGLTFLPHLKEQVWILCTHFLWQVVLHTRRSWQGWRERGSHQQRLGDSGSRGCLSRCLRTVTAAWAFTMDVRWQAAPHTGRGERKSPWPGRKASPDWFWQESRRARGLSDLAWASRGRVGSHPGLVTSWPPDWEPAGSFWAALVSQGPLGTDWPCLAHEEGLAVRATRRYGPGGLGGGVGGGLGVSRGPASGPAQQ